jgi:hypothetical protein
MSDRDVQHTDSNVPLNHDALFDDLLGDEPLDPDLLDRMDESFAERAAGDHREPPLQSSSDDD